MQDVAPIGTPAAVVMRLNASANAALRSAPLQQPLIRRWAEVMAAAHIERP